MRILRFGLVLIVLSSLFVGCSGRVKQDPMLMLSSAEALAEGKALLEKEKYKRARDFFIHAFEAEPNSVTGREALLLAADTYYAQGGSSNLILAEAKYRDFQNRFPTSNRADYVQMQIGNSLAGRSERSDRDQSTTREAAGAFQELIRLYPTSEYVEEAEVSYAVVLGKMADHEWEVGKFYIRFGLPRAAAARFEYLLETFPEYPEKDQVLYHLGLSYARLLNVDRAGEVFAQLLEEYPDSTWTARYHKETKTQ